MIYSNINLTHFLMNCDVQHITDRSILSCPCSTNNKVDYSRDSQLQMQIMYVCCIVDRLESIASACLDILTCQPLSLSSALYTSEVC